MAAPPRGSFEWSKAYFRNGDADLCETRATMSALMTYADFNDLTCYPSQKTLARNTGLSVDTIRRHIRKNVEAGWLEIVEPGSSYRSATTYRLTTPSTGAGGSSPTARTDAAQPLARVQPTPSTHAGSTPSTGAALTTHTTIHRSTHGSTQSQRDPLADGSSGSHLPSDATNHVPTPSTGAGGGAGTGAAWDSDYDPFARVRWPRDRPLPNRGDPDHDPFATYVDDETGEPLR